MRVVLCFPYIYCPPLTLHPQNMLVLTMFLCLLDPCCVTFYLVRCLHKAAKRGKEEAWPFVPSQDITRQDLERFAHKHSLGHITVTSTDSVLTMTVEVWNLDEFTKFEAYGDKHSGTVWTNGNDNPAAVVPPAILILRQTHQTASKCEGTRLQCRVNTFRWNTTQLVLNNAFKGKLGTKMKRLTDNHIARTGVKGITTQLAARRINVWKLCSKLKVLVHLASVKVSTSIDASGCKVACPPGQA
jgi:hypothetical protein